MKTSEFRIGLADLFRLSRGQRRQVPVLIVPDRSGATGDFQPAAATTAATEPLLRAVLAADAVLCSDGARVYRAVAQHLHVTHRPLHQSPGFG